MYKKFITWLFLSNMLFMAGWVWVKGIQVNRLASMPAFQLSMAENYQEPKADKFFGLLKRASSGQRVVDYEILERKDIYQLS